MLNNSIQALEYSIAYTIKKITTQDRPKVGFLQGQGELDKMHLADITQSLNEFYNVDSVVINQQLSALNDYKALIVASPDSSFNEKDKFIIDQFVMKGGKILWLLDGMTASMDSIDKKTSSTIGLAKTLNLEDQLFKYGVRVNPDLIEDLQAAPIPIVTSYIGNQPQQKLLPWYFFPLLLPSSKHPIVNNLNAIKCEFASTIDTIQVPGVKKTIILSSSQYSKVQYSPARINLNILRFEPDLKQYNKPNLPVAVLLEGRFSSVFTNRIPAVIANDPKIGFKDKSEPNKMIVVSDGDIIKNNLKKNSHYIYPLGYDRATGQTYGNKNFILNCIDYLCDDSGLISVRSKELKLRLLNKNKVDKEKYIWQIINVSLPLLLIIIYGFIQNYLRRKRFAN
jgi:ABC-2 type transport system permease protein